jgi:hydrogenase-4 component B
MLLILLGLAILVFGGLIALVLSRRPVAAVTLGAGSTIAGCLVGLAGLVGVFVYGQPARLVLPWNTPLGGSFAVSVDGLSALFLGLVLGFSVLAALYGAEYLLAYKNRKNLGLSWFFLSVLVASMALVCLAANGLLFLLAWEAMSLSSYFLVMFEHERPEVRRAGWTYLVATHLGSAALLVMFVMLAGGPGGSFDFDSYGAMAQAGHSTIAVVFVLALVGFGTKAGFMPLHIWLPEAHPVAPSHVSALMSGVMIKMGIYGLLRTITFLGTPEPWWGWTLIAIGATGAVLGILLALAQHNLKRLLAYSSVENVGLITVGLGVGLVGWSIGSPVVTVLGLAGGLLHVINHAMFKGLLFFGAGAVNHATHTLDIDQLGGLGKRMPWTAALFVVGAVAICGLPPLNGFVGEFLMYLGAYRSVAGLAPAAATPSLAVIAALALVGGMAAACFAKAAGTVFLGEPRSPRVAEAHEVGLAMRLAMTILAAGCIIGGLAGPVLVGAVLPVVTTITHMPEADLGDGLAAGAGSLNYITVAAILFFVLVGGLVLVRRWLLAGRSVEQAGTWDCGYVTPTARMQYTGSSFVQPIVRMFRGVLVSRRKFTPPEGLLPTGSQFSTRTPDMFRETVWQPMFAYVGGALSRFRSLQHGQLQLYVLYLVLTLIALLIWKLN